MQVQINLGVPFEYTAGQPLEPLNFCGDIVLVTDPGKTNMALIVGTPFGTQLCVLQFRAPGSAYDTSAYCHDFKDFLKRFLARCKVVHFGIEQAISKRGMNHHHSSMVLTEIRANLIDVAYDLTGEKPLEINNWAWKHAILPDGMRSQSEKGSTRFLPAVYAKYQNADVTDAVCMYLYVMEKFGTDYSLVPDRVEAPLAEYTAFLLPRGLRQFETARRFSYARELSFDENCAFYINRTWERGIALVDVGVLTLEDIYRHATGFIPSNSAQLVEVVVVRS